MLGHRAVFGDAGAVGQAAQEYDQRGKGAAEILQVYKYILSTLVQLKANPKPQQEHHDTKANLTELLAETGGSARHRKPVRRQPRPRAKAKTRTTKGREGTSPITVHFPKQVRDQLKILAVQNDTTLHSLVAEAFNDMFAKYGKPEIAPRRDNTPNRPAHCRPARAGEE